jgi:hypothetical protein
MVARRGRTIHRHGALDGAFVNVVAADFAGLGVGYKHLIRMPFPKSTRSAPTDTWARRRPAARRRQDPRRFGLVRWSCGRMFDQHAGQDRIAVPPSLPHRPANPRQPRLMSSAAPGSRSPPPYGPPQPEAVPLGRASRTHASSRPSTTGSRAGYLGASKGASVAHTFSASGAVHGALGATFLRADPRT